MRHFALGLVSIGVCAVTLFAQASGGASFEVASVKPNKNLVSASSPSSVRPEGDRLTLTNVPLRQMIQMAYRVDADDVMGPGWMANERFDIAAKATAPFSSTNRWEPMLKALLIDRFRLSVHIDARATDAFDLVRSKKNGSLGASLRPSTDNCYVDLRAGKAPASGDRCGMASLFDAGITGHIKLHGVPLTVLLGVIAVELRGGAPIVDATGLSGSFDIELVWTPQPYLTENHVPDRRPESDRGAPVMTTALQEQLGLKLEPKKGSKDVVIVDRVEQPMED